MEEIVLITGASGGLGTAISKTLAKDYQLILQYNNGYKCIIKLKEELEEKYKKKVTIVKCDLTSDEELDLMLNKIYEEYGKIDVLINNAGIDRDSLLEDKTKEDFLKIYEVNTIAPFLLCKKIGLKMKKNKYGKIINIASTNGIDTIYPESIDYDSSKAALISVSQNIANYLAPYVRVNTICPGWIETQMNKNLSCEFRKQEENKILLNRFGEPEEIASVVKFLLSKEASYINNSIIRVDGGKKC